MRFGIAASASGSLYCQETTVVDVEQFRFEFRVDDNKRLEAVCISAKVPSELEKDFAWVVHPGEGGSLLHLTLGGNSEFREDLVTQLQVVESHLAFASGGALLSLDWDTPKEELWPEAEGQEASSAAYSVSRVRGYRPTQVKMGKEQIRSILVSARRVPELVIPKAFFREGLNYQNRFQYAQAFYSFYFIIEGFFAGGKFREREVLREFAKSAQLEAIAEDTIRNMAGLERHAERLHGLFVSMKLPETPRGLLKLLFRVRGNLHHYSPVSSTKHATPFNQYEFETVTLLAMYMAARAIAVRDDPGMPFAPMSTPN
jgi:hypothetical protein